MSKWSLFRAIITEFTATLLFVYVTVVGLQCLGAVCGARLVRAVHGSHYYALYGSAANELAPGYSKVIGLIAEAIGTFVHVYTIFSATDPKRMVRDSHIPVLAPLLIWFGMLMVHLATIPITGTGINPARSLGPAVVYNGKKAWDDQWIFWVGPLVGATVSMLYHQYILTSEAFCSKYGIQA